MFLVDGIVGSELIILALIFAVLFALIALCTAALILAGVGYAVYYTGTFLRDGLLSFGNLIANLFSDSKKSENIITMDPLTETTRLMPPEELKSPLDTVPAVIGQSDQSANSEIAYFDRKKEAQVGAVQLVSTSTASYST